MARAKAQNWRGSWKWYGVRSLYRWVALGEPKKPDSEVFSTTEEIDASETDERICERPIGFGELSDKDDPWRRFKFINVKVVHLMLQHLQDTPSSSCLGNEHDR